MSIYDQIYSTIANVIYGGLDVTMYQDLTCTILSTCACIFMLSLPFIVVYYILKMVTRW